MRKYQNNFTRHDFLQYSILGAAGLLLPATTNAQGSQDTPARLKAEIVKEFVGVAHSKIERVKEMLENNHLLLHASWDWGGGDFESAIEAAGHVGDKEIAGYLLSKGARYNVYLACMLGHIDVVKQVLTFNPGLLSSKGPHGFTMLHHAKNGGEEAKAIGVYLQSLGATETKVDFYKRA